MMGNGLVKSSQTLEEKDLSILKDVHEPTIHLYRVFQQRSMTLHELVKVASPNYLTSGLFGHGNTQSNPPNSISPFFGTDDELSTSRKKRTMRCQPDHGRVRNYDLRYLQQIRDKALMEQTEVGKDEKKMAVDGDETLTHGMVDGVKGEQMKINDVENSINGVTDATADVTDANNSEDISLQGCTLEGGRLVDLSPSSNHHQHHLTSSRTIHHSDGINPSITIDRPINGEDEHDEVFLRDQVSVEKKWKNVVFDVLKEEGLMEFGKKLGKRLKTHQVKPGISSKTRLTLMINRAKKYVTSSTSPIRQYNSVGAVGYGVVLSDSRIPENDFFKPDLRFRIRLRHSSIQSDDDASSCQRETSIKFADQNEDGPLDLILLTGRIALADNCNTFMKIMGLAKPEEVKEACMKDPLFHFALADAMRRAPKSYTDMSYYSQVVYLFIPSDQRQLLVKFRLVPGSHEVSESGLLDEDEQKEPWFRHRRFDATQSKSYLRDEFQKRMESFEAVRYTLQIQMTNRLEEIYWNPQLVWDERESPWLDLMRIQLTTTIPLTALCRTYFNIVDKPSCLRFRIPKSAEEFDSLQYCLSGMYTRFELDHLQIINWKNDACLKKESTRRGRVPYFVTLSTAPVKDTKSRVDVFITLIGTRGRTAPQKLDSQLDEEEYENLPPPSEGCEHFSINVESVGEILAVSLTVRHRHLTDEWFLRYLVLSDPERLRVRHFPCYNVVLSKVILRPGEVSLPQKDCHELLRQERLLELRDRKSEYQWYVGCNHLFGWIGAETTRDLPLSDRLQAEKFVGMPWDIDPTAMENLIPFLATAASRGLLPNIPLFFRQTGSAGDNLPSIGPLLRRAKTSTSRSRSSSQAALRRWRKIRFAIAFITKVRIPEGPKGEMCRSVQDDVDFGRHFLLGPNPVVVKQLKHTLPHNFPVTDAMCAGYISINQTLQMALEEGCLYLADYSILSDIPTVRKDSDHRFLAAPLVLLYERGFGDLIPLAIQLSQTPGPDNPIWTPRDNPEDWIMAKLWVKCADYHYHFAISHLLKCHFIAEPFAVAMMRQLSSSHPVYKLLKPHFRYLIVTNTLLRRHILRRNCALDKYTSIGSEGFLYLMLKYLKCHFTWNEMDPRQDLGQREVNDPNKLPYYYYRDDAVALWGVIHQYTNDMLKLFYTSNQDVVEDTEIQGWISDVAEHGFPGLDGNDSSRGLRSSREFQDNSTNESLIKNLNSERSSPVFNDFEEVQVESKPEVDDPIEKDKEISDIETHESNLSEDKLTDIPSVQTRSKSSIIERPTSRHSVRTSSSSYSSSSSKYKRLPRRTPEMANIPQSIETIDELADIVTKLIFATTCQHSATHTEALDLYGFIPAIPAMMRQPPMTRKQMCTREFIGKCLPDQFPDAYYGSLSTLLQVHKPDENHLGDSSETYFVEEAAKMVTETFQNELNKLTKGIYQRNTCTGIMYENLCPTWIPNSVEPLPFLPKIAKEEALAGKSDPNKTAYIYMLTPSVPLSILPICMYLARSNPGKGGATRAVRSSAFDRRVDGVGVPTRDKDDKSSFQRQKFNAMF